MSDNSPEIERVNEYQTKIFIRLGLSLFVFGLLLPTEWRQIFGNIGLPVSWVADTIPSVKKAAAISPIQELVQGFFGVGFLLLPFFYALYVRADRFGVRFKQRLDRATSKWKFFFVQYLFGIPFLVLIVLFFFTLPIEVRLGLTPTRAQMMFSLMVSYRFSLALFGSLIMLGILSYLWMLTVLLVGPVVYFFKGINCHGT